MIQKIFESIQKSDIDALITDEINESKTLKYKQQLPGTTDEDKKEFLADVTSFGNASGGDIIFGIKGAIDADGKKTGGPEIVEPLSGTTADAAKLRLEDIIRNNVNPRLRVQIKEVIGWGEDGKGFIILLRIPQSFASPHMVTFKGSSRFFSRNSAGKYPLDVNELRTAFISTESQTERIKRFREERLGRIIADETPAILSSPHRLVVHLIPITSFLNNERLDFSSIPEASLVTALRPIGSAVADHRFNLDGFVSMGTKADVTRIRGYCQLFMNGTIESVYSEILKPIKDMPARDKRLFIPSAAYELKLIQAINTYLLGYKYFGIIPPIVISTTLIGCKGGYMHVGSYDEGPHPIDRDTLFLPDIIIDSLDANVSRIIKPVFDSVWNACGFQKCFNYDDDGDWKPQEYL
jgi:hypothetical protein